MTDDQIKHIVNRFLNWELPDNFSPDNGISFDAVGNLGTEFQHYRRPIGTNLLNAAQAEVMVRHMLNGLPQPAPSDDMVERVAELQLAAFLAGRGSVTNMMHGTRTCKPAPSMDDFRRMAIDAIGQDTRSQVEREIVAWLRAENGTCDCCARSEGECACGAWDDYKRVALVEIIDAIEQGQYRSAQ